MTPEQWQHVKDLFAAALPLSATGRDTYLASQSEPADVLAEVRSLLASYEGAPDFLEQERPTPLAGTRIGAWRLIREIGRGGMGVVWEAERADGNYTQHAAIKLLPASLLSGRDIVRFREERQILARLDHPGIAHLLDGGTLADGSPFLVMEFVDGLPLDLWCENNRAGLRQRLRIFQAVCAAVDYAHRRLVVHRDLKPANILVTSEGPKLLDFGIARFLDAPAAGNTRSLLLTPEYASPEQIRGDPPTIATDVFSLGVLLYWLVCGRKPHTGDSPLQVMRAVCDIDPVPPSLNAGSAARDLRGALDAIVLKALRKNPEERYASAAALAQDLDAWLENRPVSAHPEPLWRRALKFALRNKLAAIAFAAAALSLTAGAGISIWQERAAHRHQVAAESRFREVRRFSRSLLFELHDAIRNLPGATPARQLLLARATEFLDNLARDSSGDAALKAELAEGYRSLGNIQGGTFSDNLGRRDDAISTFRKAVRQGQEALQSDPANLDAALALMNVYDDLTDAYLARGDLAQSDACEASHRALVADVVRRHAAEPRAMASVATSYSQIAYYRTQRNDPAAAARLYRSAVDLFLDLQAHGYTTPGTRSQHAFALKRLGAILITQNALAEAEQRYRAALRLEDADLAANPTNLRLRIDRTLTLSDLALILKRKGDLAGAAGNYEEIVRIRESALQPDPRNQRLLSLTASALANLGSAYSALKRHDEAIDLCRRAVALRDQAAAMTGQSLEAHAAAGARVALAARLLEAAADTPQPRGAHFRSQAAAALATAAHTVRAIPRDGNVPQYDRSLQSDFDDAAALLKKLPPR